MKKILFATDAAHLNRHSLDFACFLCNLTHSKLIGIFLENLELENRSADMLEEMESSFSVGASVKALKNKYHEENIRLFRDTCASMGITYKVHRNSSVPLQEVIDESRYADLIVTDVTTSFSDKREDIPTRFIKEMLTAVECPVVTAPIGFDGIEEVIFTYDESRSSVFAIKQFTYLFPALRNQKASILNVSAPGKTLGGNTLKLKEWLQAHYSSTEIIALEDEHVADRLLDYLLSRKRAFIVMGSFGRNWLSSLLTPSHATPVIKNVSQPVFIAHP